MSRLAENMFLLYKKVEQKLFSYIIKQYLLIKYVTISICLIISDNSAYVNRDCVQNNSWHAAHHIVPPHFTGYRLVLIYCTVVTRPTRLAGAGAWFNGYSRSVLCCVATLPLH